MSKADITAVATLAAHLGQRQRTVGASIAAFEEYIHGAPQCASDAMQLQRLGRNIRLNSGRQQIRWGTYLGHMRDKAETILRPYGLVAELSADGLEVLDLPPNEPGGRGFKI